MGERIAHDQMIVKYLLGELSEPERQSLEERCFSDPEFLEQVHAVEADLIEDYVRGSLPADRAERLEKHLLTSTYQRQKMEFAKSLLSSLDSEGETVLPPAKKDVKNWSQSLLMLLRPMQPASSVVFGTLGAVLLFFTGWLALEVVHLREEVSKVREEQTERQQREQTLQEVVADLQQRRGERTNNNTQNKPVEQTGTDNQRASNNTDDRKRDRSVPKQNLATFMLSPVLLRDGQGQPELLNIPSGIEAVQLQLLYDGKDYPNYQAVLETADGEPVSVKRRLRAYTESGKKIVKVEFPSDLLGNKTYIVTLRGSLSTGLPEDVSRYTFKINKL